MAYQMAGTLSIWCVSMLRKCLITLIDTDLTIRIAYEENTYSICE